MAAIEFDLAQLSSYCSLPQQSFQTLLDSPTKELVQSLLECVVAKFQEHNELVSEKLRLGVELENAVRGGETKNRALKSSVDKGLKEVADLRQKLSEEASARVSVVTELENLKNSTTESISELSSYKSRISALESSNRDTLSLLDSKSSAYDSLAEELNTQHQKTTELRRELSSLEQSVQSADAASTSARLREQGLQHEIERLKRQSEWFEKELNTKTEESKKNRKEKNLRIVELQHQYDEAQSTVESANRTETNLRRRLDEISQKADESFSKIQQMQEEAAQKEEAFGVELDAANRLTELTRNSTNTERQRQQELSTQLEAAKEDASEQLGRLGAELETEHREREAADAKVAELEVQIEQLQANLTLSRGKASMDKAYHQGVNGYSTPAQGPSTPAGNPGTPRPKGGLSITQMYSSYSNLKAEHETEKRRNEKLSSTLDDMIQALETRQPEIEELRADHNRLESEIAEMSSLVDAIGKERDQALKSAKKWEGQMEAKVKEGEVLRQQLRDLSSQIKVFLMEAHLREHGHSGVSAEARAQLELLAQGQVDIGLSDGTTDTDRFISGNLVTFRTIGELQEQNMNLLKITRELGGKMEHEESIRKQLEENQDWEDLQRKYERCKDEIKSLMTQSQSYIRERDMFRRMLAHRGRLPPGADVSLMFDESMNGATASALSGPRMMTSVDNSAAVKDLADYAKLYKDIQAHFDAYRNEAATDMSTLKQQIDNLSKLNSELRSEVVRGNSQVTLAHERYEMLQANYAMLRTENAELQRKSQSLSDGAAKQELRVQQVVEDIVEAKGMADSMRNEAANLKAEKDFWKTIEKRLTEDNDNLLNERNRLNVLNSNLQNLLNERDRSESEARRRLQSHMDTLEKDLQTTKNKLTEETEENKRTVQRREYDNEQSQKRVDDLISSLGTIREQLVAANVTKDHLSTRVEELTIELRSAEECVNVLRSTATARANPKDIDESGDASLNGDDTSFTKEQQSAFVVTELRRDLSLTKAELENVKGQVEQYKAISQASEDELQSLNETQDLYRQETDNLIRGKDQKISELAKRIEDTTSEFASTNLELFNLRNEQAENGRRLEDSKKAFEVELAQLKDQDDRHAAAAQYYQEDLKVQADIAQQAQQNYENELVKHADAAKALQKVRSDHNSLKLEIVGVKTEAESARTRLAQSEDSWTETRVRYERELAELKGGRETLRAQNNHLHQQLESVTTQISSLKKLTSGEDGTQDEELPQPGLENLQEVIKYLRREKEIVDVQLELSSQEGKRVKQQLDYTQSQLDDTRMQLNQQRRIEDNSERSNLDHNKLLETINELNTFRESSVTLRTESRQAQASLAASIAQVETLTAKIEPLQAEILELKNEQETYQGEMKLLKENSDRWQQRAQNVLQKYDRIDPAELEALKEQLKTLEAERDELIIAKQSLQEQVDNASAQITQVREQSSEKIETMRTRLTDQFKARSKTQTDKIKEKDTALQTAMNERQRLEQQLSELSGLQAKLESAKTEREVAIEEAGTSIPEPSQNARSGSEDGQLEEREASRSAKVDLQSLHYSIVAAEARASEQSSQSASLRSQLQESRSRIADLELQITQMQETIDALKAELASLRGTERTVNNDTGDEVQQQMAKLREDLAKAQQDADSLRTGASANASVTSVYREDGSKTLAEQITENVEAIREDLEARHNDRIREADETLEKRTNNMKTQLSKKLTEGKTQIRQSLVTEYEERIKKLKTEHAEEMEKLAAKYKEEFDELHRNEDSRFEKLREEREKDCRVSTDDHGESDQKAKGETHSNLWQPSEAEARAFLQSNEIARSILRKNVMTQVTKAKDELTAQLKEEHETAMTEFQAKANTSKEHAVMMEGKKTALQVNMANNKARISQFKLGVIEKAAQETPRKPVEEVWSVAKDVKPPPTTGQQPQPGSLKLQQVATAVSSGQPTSSTQAPHQRPGANGLGQPSPYSQGIISAQQQPTQANQLTQQSAIQTFGRPSPAPSPAQAPLPGEPEKTAQQQPAQSQVSSSVANGNQRSTSSQISSVQPHKLSQPAVKHHPNAGPGPGTPRGLQQSGLPVVRSGAMRGNISARGRGSSLGRGGSPAVNTDQGQQQGKHSPGGGGLNPGAKQFVPGNKRPRDDEQLGGDAGIGKRIRGGGA